MQRRFTVIIATYNREDYLRQAIDSVLAQTFTDYEFIIVDDGSTDRTQEIIQSYGTKIKNIRQENQGSEMAYKTGVSHANGQYMAFLDSDDYFFSNALATYDKIITYLDYPPLIMGAMQRFDQNQVVRIDMGCVDGDIEVLKYRDYLSKDVRIGMAQSMIVMKKTLFEEAQKGTGIPRARNMNDYRLILRSGIFGPCVIVTRPVTLAYRYHETQCTKNIEKMCQGVLYLIDMVRHGETSAGRSRLFDRYAYMGGPVSEWSRKAFKAHLPGLAFRIILKGWRMMIMNQLNKLILFFYRPAVRVKIATNSNGEH